MEERLGPDLQEKAVVFISYSRADREHAERIANELRQRGHDVVRDLDDILPTEEWQSRLESLITEADVIVFLLSPKSAASEVCRWEVDLAQALNKKIAPIVIEDVRGAQIPAMLSRLNYIFATERDRFENAIDSLCDAIGTDIDWLREHTRLTRLAVQFDKSGRRHCDLLSEAALADAEKWVMRKPASVLSITPLVADYVETSRSHHVKRAHYAKARLAALSTFVEPMLVNEIEELGNLVRRAESARKPAISQSEVRMADVSAEAGDLRARIETVENFRSKGGRWHPLPAEHLHTADWTADYVEVWKFPCCGRFVTTGDKEPFQFRADGCESDPAS